ncbi:MAG: STM3941 family protein [Crocinitomicaceae bacterium]
MSTEVLFPINKRKLRIQGIIYGVLAIVIFLLMFGYADKQDYISPMIFQGLGVVIPLFCVIAAGAKGKKISDPSAGLKIDKSGVHDETTHIALGLIKWGDIEEILEEQSLRTGLLLISVKKDEKYLKAAKNSAIERLLRQNIRMYKTPVAIDTSYLQGSLKEVIAKIKEMKR